jgi:hypothetical protein
MYVVFSMCGMSVFHQACAYIFISVDIFLVSGEAPLLLICFPLILYPYFSSVVGSFFKYEWKNYLFF